MAKTWKVVLAFAGVFLAGAIGGAAVGLRLHGPFGFGGHPPPRQFVSDVMRRMSERLELTEEQKAKIAPILQKAQEDVDGLRRSHVKEISLVMERMHSDVAALLTAEQRAKLDEMRKQFRERSIRLRGGDFREGGGPPPFRDDGTPPAPPPES